MKGQDTSGVYESGVLCPPEMALLDALSLQDPRKVRDTDSVLRLLSDCSAKLAYTVSGTEEEFLSVGSKLREFSMQSRDITGAAASVSGLLSGEKVRQTVDGLNTLFERIALHSKKFESEMELRRERLADTQARISAIADLLREFGRISRKLAMAGVSVKIQSATLPHGGSGFGVLANEIEKLSKIIASESAAIGKDLNSLNAVIEQTLLKLENLAGVHLEKMKTLISGINSSLSSLSGMHSAAVAVSQDIMARTSDISRNLGEVVTFLQYHDISRQEFEQVRTAISGLNDRLMASSRGNGSNSLFLADHSTEVVRTILESCSSQRDFLADAVGRFMAALGKIKRHLSGILTMTRGISEEVEDLADGSVHQGNSLFRQIEKTLSSITAILETFNENAEARQELSESVAAIVEATQRVSGLAEHIGRLNDDIKLIALNAGVKALKGGDEARSLYVLAEEVQRLSGRTEDLTVAISGEFTKIMGFAWDLSSEPKKMSAGDDDEVHDMQATGAELVQAFSSLNSGIGQLLSSLKGSEGLLSKGIEQVIGSWKTYETAEQDLKAVVDCLGEIADVSRSVLSEERAKTAIGARRIPGAVFEKTAAGELRAVGAGSDSGSVEFF